MLAVCAFTGLFACLRRTRPLFANTVRVQVVAHLAREGEHNPGYDIPFMLSCPDEEVDLERMASWFTGRISAALPRA